ncbi:flagellar hook-basal body complex protein FliE [Fonticella tunisiensis]|uniref:Flagellar hook-basal body complex protein FliE n=1 Tax=Fonticella tunisiensis TaxID=1096341 RepID=A0A4R7K9B5_9CLOT|nr:flagellar hook-basal body complex protein FliE [Fonticella tunisiensis]
MNINTVSFQGLTEIQNKNNQNNSSKVNFADVLKNALDKVNEIQINAENATTELITGEATDIHQVMLATEEAKLSLELAVQVRNKLVEAYQELMRMQL